MLVCFEQSKGYFRPNATLARKRCGFEFGSVIGICPAKSRGDNPACKWPSLKDRRVLMGGKFTLPFAPGTAVAAGVVIERVAPAKCAVAQHRDAAAITVEDAI